MDADVGDAATGANQLGAELERVRDADSFDRRVDAAAVRELHDTGERVLAAVVDHHVCAEVERAGEPRVGQVDRDDLRRACAAGRS